MSVCEMCFSAVWHRLPVAAICLLLVPKWFVINPQAAWRTFEQCCWSITVAAVLTANLAYFKLLNVGLGTFVSKLWIHHGTQLCPDV